MQQMPYMQQPQMQRTEHTLLAEQGIIVSTARFVVGTTTYPLAGITAVSTSAIKPKYLLPLILILFGLPLLPAKAPLGLPLLLAGIAIIVLSKKRFVVRMATAGGQVDALASKDRAYIERVVSALNTAIIQRG
jgi:hypothetical protein